MDSISSINNTLPFSTIIGAPFKAACDAQILLAKSIAEFIKEVGFVEPDRATKKSETRNVDFSFIRPIQDRYGNVVEEKVELQVPMLAIVNIPNMSIKSMDVVFDMEIKTVEHSGRVSNFTSDEMDKNSSITEKRSDTNVQIHGKVATHKENTRNSDNSAKYHIEVRAEREGIPEGLSRIIDILATSVAPRRTEVGRVIQKPNNTAPEYKSISSGGNQP